MDLDQELAELEKQRAAAILAAKKVRADVSIVNRRLDFERAKIIARWAEQRVENDAVLNDLMGQLPTEIVRSWLGSNHP